jgi:hypothetical protein
MSKQVLKKIIIPSKKLLELNLSVEQFLYLVLLKRKFNNIPFHNMLIYNKQIEYKDGEFYVLDEELDKLLETVCNSKVFSDENEKKFLPIAEKLQQIYPKGFKPNTTTVWRGNKTDICTRLAKLEEETGIDLNEELLVKATQLYVDSFGDNRQKMRILPYFIYKNEIKNGQYEFCSDLLSIIQAIEDGVEPQQNNDWIGELK